MPEKLPATQKIKTLPHTGYLFEKTSKHICETGINIRLHAKAGNQAPNSPLSTRIPLDTSRRN